LCAAQSALKSAKRDAACHHAQAAENTAKSLHNREPLRSFARPSFRLNLTVFARADKLHFIN
jgi:hypothetical protein